MMEGIREELKLGSLEMKGIMMMNGRERKGDWGRLGENEACVRERTKSVERLSVATDEIEGSIR